MRFFPFPRMAALVCAFLAAARLAQADTVLLKNGEKLEGKITQENETELTIEYKVTASISDSRTVKKAEIDKVEKESEEEKTYQRLARIKVGENGYPAATYEQIIAALQDFLTKFPKSAHAAEIQKNLDAFKEEKSRVEAGEIKIGGKWLSKSEAEKERYQLSGTVLFGKMQELAARRDYVGAMNTFDLIEKNYPGSYAYPDAADLARQITTALKPLAERTLTDAKQRKIDRDRATQLASEPEKSQLIAAQKREQEQGDAAVEAADRDKTAKWPPFLPNNEKSLTKISTLAGSEQRRIESLPVAKMRQSITLSEKGRTQIAEDATAAQDSLRQASSLWSANEVAQRLQKELAANQQAANQPKATPAPEPSGETPAGTPAPAGKTTKTTKTTKPASTPRAAAAPAPAPAPASPETVEEPKPFYTSIPFAIGLVVVLGIVFVGMNMYRRMQEKKNAPTEE